MEFKINFYLVMCQVCFNNRELLIICETHFGIRHKCPENFVLIGKSKPHYVKKLRGGVAIYKKN